MKNLILAVAALFAVEAGAQDRAITASDLPKDAQTFLKQHFKTASVEGAEIDLDGTKKTFEVRMSDGTEIEFDSNGIWKEVDAKNKAIPSEFISSEIRNYLTANYPNQRVTKISKGRRGVEVELMNGTELDFDNDGKFVRLDR